MPVTRRTVLKQLVLVSAGAALLPACVRHRPNSSIATKHFQLSDDQQRMLEELTAAILPSGPTAGARETGAAPFVLTMLDDCTSATDRDTFLRGLRQLNTASRQTSGADFLQTDASQRATLLTALESGKLPDKDLNFFYTTTKKGTIQAYTSSQYYLTKVQVYELVPGRWHGCVPVKAQKGATS